MKPPRNPVVRSTIANPKRNAGRHADKRARVQVDEPLKVYTVWFALPNADWEMHLEFYRGDDAAEVWGRLEAGGFIVRGDKP